MSRYTINRAGVKKGTAQTVAASETQTVVSDDIVLSSEDSKNFLASIEMSAAEEITGITFELQELIAPDTWVDVGSESQVSPGSDTAADANVDTGDNHITSGSHPFATGDAIVYVSSAGNVITGLTDSSVYYVIKVDANDFRLATTKANAEAGTAISITQPAGGDTHYFTSIEPVEIRMNIEDSTDQAQMPLWPVVRVVATTGASDSVTVSAIHVTQRM